MNKLFIFCILFSYSLVCYSQQWSIASGTDVIHAKGSSYVELRYNEQFWSAYVGSNKTIGLGTHYTWNKVLMGIGLEYSQPSSDIVSTGAAYELRLEYQYSPSVSFGIKHRSNCKTVCKNFPLNLLPHGDENTVNHGYNYFIVRYSF